MKEIIYNIIKKKQPIKVKEIQQELLTKGYTASNRGIRLYIAKLMEEKWTDCIISGNYGYKITKNEKAIGKCLNRWESEALGLLKKARQLRKKKVELEYENKLV